MRIVRILERTVPLASAMRNAVIDFSTMTASVVAVVTDVVRDGSPVVGFGFNSNGRYGQGGIIRERLLPRLEHVDSDELVDHARDNLDPHAIWRAMMTNEKPGGHGERSVAVGTVDMAVWDAVAKIESKPLHQLLSARYGQGEPTRSVEVYAAGGYYHPEGGVDRLCSELRGYLDQGYTRVKMKVGGASLEEDLERIGAAVEAVGSGSRLAVDANARFGRAEAIAFREAIAGFGLAWYEEPCDPLDYQVLAEVAAGATMPIATGENLFSLPDTVNLVRYGGLRSDRDIIQVDPVLSYGLVEYLRILEMLDGQGWSRSQLIPHGGHQFALHIAAGLGTGGNESYPEVFRPFGGFADDAPIRDGMIELDDRPGIGIEGKADLLAVFHDLLESA